MAFEWSLYQTIKKKHKVIMLYEFWIKREEISILDFFLFQGYQKNWMSICYKLNKNVFNDILKK